MPKKKSVLLVANTSWLIQNFLSPFIRDLQENGFEIIAGAPYDEWSPRFENLGVRYVPVPMSRKGLNPIADLILLVRLYRLYRTESPDFVFHNTVKPVIYGSLAAKLVGMKSVINMIPGLGHVFIGRDFTHRVLRFIVKRMYRLTISGRYPVFFQNPSDRDYFVQSGIVDEIGTAVTFGYGVDLERFSCIQRQNKNGVCTFLLVARMLWTKGVGDFVEAAMTVKKESPGARFQLLGRIDRDNPSGISKATLEEWTLSGSVEYLGEVQDVRSIISEADVVVLPSYYREGVPNALMEAMAMGKAIITTDMPGCRETVVDKINGLLVPPRDIQALIRAIRLMISEPKMRTEMGRESRSLAVQRFDVKRVNAMILDAMKTSVK